MDLKKEKILSGVSELIRPVVSKVFQHDRISVDDALKLYHQAEIGLLGILAGYVRNRFNGQKVFYNKNFHLEPTNICIHNCRFCSYSRKHNEEGAWEHSMEEMLEIVRSYQGKYVGEVHIVGGVHPERDINYYVSLIKEIKKILPEIHVKAFTAVEIDHMIKKGHLELESGLKVLKESGLDSIPGGGAEIFDDEIRKKICHEKSDASTWLKIHQTAHELGIPSNATMLYGHIENYEHRVDHLNTLRKLQDQTSGFNAFIPLKYKNRNNEMSELKEVNMIEDMRNYAVSRIFLDNIPHIKAYWPMLGKEAAQLSLSFGVDDLDGTIDDSTKIYSMAGANDQKPTMNTEEMRTMILKVNRIPVERDSVYNELG